MSDTATRNANVTNLPESKGINKRPLWFGIFIASALIAFIFAFTHNQVTTTRENMENEMRQRQLAIAETKSGAADTWIRSLEERIGRFAQSQSETFQIAVTQLVESADDMSEPPAGSEPEGALSVPDASAGNNKPFYISYVRTLLSGFYDNNDFSEICLVNRSGEPAVSTRSVINPLTSIQLSLSKEAMKSGKVIYGPIVSGTMGTSFDIFFPVMPPQYRSDRNTPIAVLILTHPMDQKLTEFLTTDEVEAKTRQIRIVQKNGDIFQYVFPGMKDPKEIEAIAQDDLRNMPFGLRTSTAGDEEVYSSGNKIRSIDWWIVVESDASIIQNATSDYAKNMYLLAALASVGLALLVSAVWWRLIGRAQSAVNQQIGDMLYLIEDQKKLLDGINSAMSDPISLTDSKGVYRYVNAAFAGAVGRSADDVIGLDGPAIFGFDTARRLNVADQHVLMTGESITVNEVLWLQSKRFNFQISKTPLKDTAGKAPQGIVSVFRDITKLVETEERSRRMVQQTINALVSAIEEADPFLGGHSRIMGSIASLVARQMQLNDADIATIEAAANLSQVGKMFVPREILLKPGVLTPEEKKEMELHVEHAREALKDIEFDLPVLPAIYQMNERMDGKGYPKGLTGDKLSIHAKVLAVANAFTAMARPRSYRPALPAEEVLSYLESQTGSYDQEVVASLRSVMHTPAGEKLVEQAASSTAV